MRNLIVSLCLAHAALAAPIGALIIDGQNNHNWKSTTPVLKKILEDTGLFQVEVLTAPPKGGDFSALKPDFKKYQVIVSNYNEYPTGDKWPEAVRTTFEQWVRDGGGFVSFHAADNAFPEWPEYNLMIGIGGWLGRNEKAGPKWMHAADELYSKMRGPGKNMTVLATAWSDPANRGTGHDEPVLMALSYGKGRVFHTTLGDNVEPMQCVGFIVTLARGAEWAATGKVSQKVPPDFPTDKVSIRPAVARP